MNPISEFFGLLRKLGVALGLVIAKAGETEALDEAQIEAGIRDQRRKATAANFANGQLQTAIILIKDQIRDKMNNIAKMTNLLQLAADTNNESDGAHYAAQLDDLNQDLARDKEQLEGLNATYTQNVEIIANSIKETQRFEREFVAMKARVKTSKSLENLATLMKSSMSELQGMTDSGQALGRMKERAAGGEGQMKATLDLAQKVGGDIRQEQDSRNARGKALFEQFKKRGNLTNTEIATPTATEAKAPERQKIAEGGSQA